MRTAYPLSNHDDGAMSQEDRRLLPLLQDRDFFDVGGLEGQAGRNARVAAAILAASERVRHPRSQEQTLARTNNCMALPSPGCPLPSLLLAVMLLSLPIMNVWPMNCLISHACSPQVMHD